MAVLSGCLLPLRDLDEGDVHGIGQGFLLGRDVFADGNSEGLNAGGLFQRCSPFGGTGYVPVANGQRYFDHGVGGFALVGSPNDGVRERHFQQILLFHRVFEPDAEFIAGPVGGWVHQARPAKSESAADGTQ